VDEIPVVAAAAVAGFLRHFGANPRSVSAEDGAALYRAAW
jgi:hypothetical protein